MVICSAPEDTAIGSALYEQVKQVGYHVKLIREHELHDMNRIKLIMENAALFIPIISTNGIPDDILKLGHIENNNRRGKHGEEYFMMPLHVEQSEKPDMSMTDSLANCLHLNSIETPLTDDDLERIYYNLCIYEDR